MPLPTDGGLWVRQHHQHPHQHQRQRQPSPEPAQPDTHEESNDQPCRTCPQQPSAPKSDLFVVVNPNLNSSSSDLASPLTPTFSQHGGSHLRYASSTSSIDLQQSFSSACSEASVSPVQPSQSAQSASPTTATSTKRPLPDVQEDPLERDDAGETTMSSLTDDQLESLYDCLCMSMAPIILTVCTPSSTGRPCSPRQEVSLT